ncbi:hypothetical protein BLNAU_22078 [Blattamonas nauphoetae]|uniref:Uncharacterized protein n=1 Tax=Blattamonas nauphoetae TaxID=2049346 RepID=A0ABQ9WU35_9EUKA|nr:hypothetical protein BLNAU_22078 [Blattamonas nauphoetae]
MGAQKKEEEIGKKDEEEEMAWKLTLTRRTPFHLPPAEIFEEVESRSIAKIVLLDYFSSDSAIYSLTLLPLSHAVQSILSFVLKTPPITHHHKTTMMMSLSADEDEEDEMAEDIFANPDDGEGIRRLLEGRHKANRCERDVIRSHPSRPLHRPPRRHLTSL